MASAPAGGAVGAVSVISWGFLAALGSVSVLVWIVLWSARRRRHIVVIGIATLAVVLSLASAADAVNAHYQYLPRVSDLMGQHTWPTATHLDVQLVDAAGSATSTSPIPPVVSPKGSQLRTLPTARTLPTLRSARSALAHPRGAVVTLSVSDAGVGFSARHVLVYLPPQYFTNPTARFPVVYLLHGSPGIPIDWLRGGGAAQAGLDAARANRPQIVVIPTLSRNWLDDSECVNGTHLHVEDYVVSDVIPGVDAQLRTLADRSHRTIAGMSAGGYCALNLGLRHRALFGSIVDMSGYTHPTHSGGMIALFGHRPDIASTVAANSPDIYVSQLSASPASRVYLLCGNSDHHTLQEMAAMRDHLRAHGMNVSWKTVPGSHTYGVWRPGLANVLRSWTPS
jgi:enterochelin esterase-like enzyme